LLSVASVKNDLHSVNRQFTETAAAWRFMTAHRVAVVGAGAGGLAAAIDLAAQGLEVVVLERAATPGGKMRQVWVDGVAIDAGPTVFTMRWVFEDLFADAGACFSAALRMHPADVLARHAWCDGSRLDLFADMRRTSEAIGDFAGAPAAQGYADFCARSRRAFQVLDTGFMRQAKPSVLRLLRNSGPRGVAALLALGPWTSLWQALARDFHDPRLHQLFARYATYCGASPFQAPATLMLIAHVEQQGVWLIEGGMSRLARALEELAAALGVAFRYGTEVAEVLVTGGKASGVRLADGEPVEAAAVIVNADVAAVSGGCFGQVPAVSVSQPQARRSLSAVTWALHAETARFPLLHHNVFFSRDYAAEFADIFGESRLPVEPTVYVCAQDRSAAATGSDSMPPGARERLFCLINAPANGGAKPFTPAEMAQCEKRTFGLLARCGLQIQRQPEASLVTTPADFEALFPATGGALYGSAVHGTMAAFRRPSARTRLPGLYLTGGSVHPGAGLPMATLSGRMAAARVMADLTSTGRWRRAATPGGMLMRSATRARMDSR
jgi:1-hydroxycarotenoid 3,4-desaturase